MHKIAETLYWSGGIKYFNILIFKGMKQSPKLLETSQLKQFHLTKTGAILKKAGAEPSQTKPSQL